MAQWWSDNEATFNPLEAAQERAESRLSRPNRDDRPGKRRKRDE
jgi:hypothetical protein